MKFFNQLFQTVVVRGLLILTIYLPIQLGAHRAKAQGFPDQEPVIPNSLGINIHFTDPQPGEMLQLANSGVRWVRMDLHWSQTEKKRGVYDFSAYDRLLAALKVHRIKLLLILDFSNPLYDGDLSPYTENGRQAFSRWTSAAVKRFQGNGILWEMYNEPNIVFWRPKPNVDHYILLARAVGKAIRDVSPKEVYIGPAVAFIDLSFLEACFKGGLLKQWSAVSVHPYRSTNPETVVTEYRSLRELIKKYAPQGKKISILSGEWGYASSEIGIDVQSKYLARQWLINLASNIPLSIWYDWRDDGNDPKNKEHHFGIVYEPRNKSGLIAYKPKPAYLAAKTLTSIFQGFRFNKRLNIGKIDDYILVFSKGKELRISAWTTSAIPHNLKIPIGNGTFKVLTHIGNTESLTQTKAQNISLEVTNSPKYIVFVKSR